MRLVRRPQIAIWEQFRAHLKEFMKLPVKAVVLRKTFLAIR
jgi:hypothetical protein